MKLKAGDLVKINNNWWDGDVVDDLWIVGDPNSFDNCFLISIKSRERYLQNIDFNCWANDFRIKKTKVPAKYLTKVNWDQMKKTKTFNSKIAKLMIFILIVLVTVLISLYIKIMFHL